MLVKYYDDVQKDINAGVPYDLYFSGRIEVKEYQPDKDGNWIKNPAYSYEKTIENKNKLIEYKRKARYLNETDPLFFQFQRGTGTKDEWLAAIEVVKQELPYVV